MGRPCRSRCPRRGAGAAGSTNDTPGPEKPSFSEDGGRHLIRKYAAADSSSFSEEPLLFFADLDITGVPSNMGAVMCCCGAIVDFAQARAAFLCDT